MKIPKNPLVPDAEPAYINDGLSRWLARSESIMLVIALGSLPILLLEVEIDRLPQSDQRLIEMVNIFVFAAFTIDYLVGLWLTNDKPAYFRGEWMNLLIVLSSGAAILPTLASFGAFRALRALRPARGVFAVLRAVSAGGRAARTGKSLIRQNAMRFVVGVTILTWLTSAAAFTVAEDVGVNGTNGEGYADALWWAAATITTVGYGDIYPVTTAGRAVGLFSMVIGISLFAIVTAKISSFFTLDE